MFSNYGTKFQRVIRRLKRITAVYRFFNFKGLYLRKEVTPDVGTFSLKRPNESSFGVSYRSYEIPCMTTFWSHAKFQGCQLTPSGKISYINRGKKSAATRKYLTLCYILLEIPLLILTLCLFSALSNNVLTFSATM